MFKEAQIMKKNVQNSSKDEKESLKDVKWEMTMFQGALMTKNNLSGTSSEKNNL